MNIHIYFQNVHFTINSHISNRNSCTRTNTTKYIAIIYANIYITCTIKM